MLISKYNEANSQSRRSLCTRTKHYMVLLLLLVVLRSGEPTQAVDPQPAAASTSTSTSTRKQSPSRRHDSRYFERLSILEKELGGDNDSTNGHASNTRRSQEQTRNNNNSDNKDSINGSSSISSKQDRIKSTTAATISVLEGEREVAITDIAKIVRYYALKEGLSEEEAEYAYVRIMKSIFQISDSDDDDDDVMCEEDGESSDSDDETCDDEDDDGEFLWDKSFFKSILDGKSILEGDDDDFDFFFPESEKDEPFDINMALGIMNRKAAETVGPFYYIFLANTLLPAACLLTLVYGTTWLLSRLNHAAAAGNRKRQSSHKKNRNSVMAVKAKAAEQQQRQSRGLPHETTDNILASLGQWLNNGEKEFKEEGESYNGRNSGRRRANGHTTAPTQHRKR